MTDFKQKLQYNSSNKQHEPSKLKRQQNIRLKKQQQADSLLQQTF